MSYNTKPNTLLTETVADSDTHRKQETYPYVDGEIAIFVEDLSKCFQIYNNPRDRLKQSIVPNLQRLVGHQQSAYFSEFWALKDVSFTVKKGETVGIIGRNGSGKSTLLQIICGTLSPTTGRVETNGRIAALLELGSGFNPEFTGRENVYLNAAVLGMGSEEVDMRFDDIAAFADIGQFMNQPVKTYSSGMSVRLAFAVQAVLDPDIFVVDEALAVGDEKFQRKCFARLEELKSRGSSILFVSHSPASVIELCDRTLLLEHGNRLMYGPAPKAVRAYQRLIYSTAEEYETLIREIGTSDQSIDVGNSAGNHSPAVASEEMLGDAFDTGLVPETTTVYPAQGGLIESIEIRNGKGQPVNILHPARNYEFVISGRFMEDFAGINFGVHIRSISGIVITGQRYPEEPSYVEHVREGQQFRIIFSFQMKLLPGVYFAGCGIWSKCEPACVHRILDAIMFRVVSSGPAKAFGYIDASAAPPQLEFS